MKRKDAWNAGLKFYRDDSGEIRRTHDNKRMHSKRAPCPARIEARRKGEPRYVDEYGYLRSTQSGALIANPTKPRPAKRAECPIHGWSLHRALDGKCRQCFDKRKLTPRAKRAECPVHGWALHKIDTGECKLCIDRAVK